MVDLFWFFPLDADTQVRMRAIIPLLEFEELGVITVIFAAYHSAHYMTYIAHVVIGVWCAGEVGICDTSVFTLCV